MYKFVNRSLPFLVWPYYEPLSLYYKVWVGQINIGTLVVKGLKFVDDSLALTKSYPDAEFHVYWYYGY